MAMIFDTHAHYDDEAFKDDYRQILESFPEHGIAGCVDVGSTMESIDRVLEIADEFPYVYAALGIHPSECADLTEEFILEMKKKCADPKVRAIGEIGLDYHYPDEGPDKDLQKKWFERQLDLAKELDLPVIIHSRDAAKDTFDILNNKKAVGVMHCYSYSKEMAMDYIAMGFFIGIGGVVTFKNAKKVKEVVREIPLTSIVLETDCPYMAPTPHRGERNSSLYLPLVVDVVAELKGVTPEEVTRTTQKNAERLYRL